MAYIERKVLGGTCVNTVCTPAKTLAASAYATQLVHRAADYGIVIEGAVNTDVRKILGSGGDEAIHRVLEIMNARVPYDVLQHAMHIHPTVSELIPTVLGELKPA